MNISDRIEALKEFERVPRDIISSTHPDFVAWRAVLPRQFAKFASERQVYNAFQLWLQVTDPGLRDYWRFIRYVGKMDVGRRNPRYPLTRDGFLDFLQTEPGRVIPKIAGAVIGWTVGGPVAAVAGAGAAAGAQSAQDAGTSLIGGAAKGAVGGFGTALEVAAPLLGAALPGTGGTARTAGAGLRRLGPDLQNPDAPRLQDEEDNAMPEKYRRLLNSLIEIESGGDPSAVSPSGTYVGLLQMGQPAATDVGISDVRDLLGNSSAAIDAFWRYQALYKSRTGGHPFLMALLWKGGPGTVSKFLRMFRGGATLGQALANVQPPSWKIVQYMRRFAQAWADQ